MKKMRPLILIALLATIVTGCSTSENVTGGVFQKRKYTKGFYWNRSGKTVTAEEPTPIAVKDQQELRSETVVPESGTRKKAVIIAETTVNTEYLTTSETVEHSIQKQETKQLLKKSKPANKSAFPGDEKPVTVLKKNKSVGDVLRKKQQHQSAPSSGDYFILAVIFAILIPPLGVAIHTNIDWLKVLICLLLTFLFFLPGMIYALLVVFDVF